ncbi:Mth938-like domain-containing protein [Celeribacter sp.]|uniref:Mth938-like domain-containing protein n=1 Tax=Celeribacter sp. TaxID=1890673 RepID=UPI003A8FC51E
MQINDMPFEDAVPIDGYGPNFFRVNGEVHEGAMLLIGPTPAAWGGYDDAASLLALAERVDFILFGTGPEMAHIPAALRSQLDAAGIGAEVMATPTACRSYNILASEGRRIAVALLPV